VHAVRFYTTLSSTAVCQFLLIKNYDDYDDDDDDDDDVAKLHFEFLLYLILC